MAPRAQNPARRSAAANGEVEGAVRRRLDVRGRVQGVGFRPFVYRLATEERLGGFVGNDERGAFLEVEGPPAIVARFRDRLQRELPPLARISELIERDLPPRGDGDFRIERSERHGRGRAEVAPDTATCPDCLRELLDPADRRHRYPFINCTNCGPRYSIVRGVPYDRDKTTMAAFALCPACQGEYDDPGNRRFHAQPNACPVCGPRVWLCDAEGRAISDCGFRISDLMDGGSGAAVTGSGAAQWATEAQRRGGGEGECAIRNPQSPPNSPADHADQGANPKSEIRNPKSPDPIRLAAQILRDGGILAVKGLGGFHLAVRADSEPAVRRLRQRKHRDAKPLAVMVATLDDARALAELDDTAIALLTGPQRPIVLAPKRDGALAPSVAPGSGEYGILLPYTPLHHLLLRDAGVPLVMTSGNPSDEPLCHRNDEALRRLAPIADAFLLHDRDIERPIDDSVVKVLAGDRERPTPESQTISGGNAAAPTTPPDCVRGVPSQGGNRRTDSVNLSLSKGAPSIAFSVLRRARGYVPDPIRVRDRSAPPILAVGGELKSTVCLLDGERAVLSEHLGELPNPAAFRNFLAAAQRLQDLLEVAPALVACDLHPDYTATRWARSLGLPVTEVQHHHAHVVSCMAEHGLTGSVVGVSCDGTGYGTDGAIWGGEVLVCDESDFRRFAHLRYYPLPGGDAGAREAYRPAVGLLRETYGDSYADAAAFALARVAPDALTVTAHRCGSAVRTSSLGRLFDAAAFLLGVCDRNDHEAQAPMALEAMALEHARRAPLEYGGCDAALAIAGCRGLRSEAQQPRPRTDEMSPAFQVSANHGTGPRNGSAEAAPAESEREWNSGGEPPHSKARSIADGGSAIEDPDVPLPLDFAPSIRMLVEGMRAGRDVGELAWAFHDSLAALFADAAVRAARESGCGRVVLSGGCFANGLLLRGVAGRVRERGLDVYVHQQVPPGDGGLALGQAVVAAERYRRQQQGAPQSTQRARRGSK